MRTNKFNNRYVRLMGKTFDSRAEANRFIYLLDRQRRGEITDLEHHKRFDILTFRGRKIGTWESDFFYLEPTIDYFDEIIEDVKGYRTREWKRTKALVEDTHDIKITEIPAKSVPDYLGKDFVDETNDTYKKELAMAFTSKKIIPAGVYVGRVMDIKEQENKFDPDKPRRQWTWEIVEDEDFHGETLLDWTGTSTGAKSKAGPILKALGFELDGEDVSENDVIGKRGKLVVSEEEKDGQNYNKILNVLPMSSKEKKGKDPTINM